MWYVISAVRAARALSLERGCYFEKAWREEGFDYLAPLLEAWTSVEEDEVLVALSYSWASLTRVKLYRMTGELRDEVLCST